MMVVYCEIRDLWDILMCMLRSIRTVGSVAIRLSYVNMYHTVKLCICKITNYKKGLTEYMAKKLSSSGPTFENLVKISKILGRDGFFRTLIVKQADDKPRVTNVKWVIEKYV